MVQCLLQLKKVNMPHLFTPHLFESQPCESLFRQVRSLSTTYSTVVNCSVKEFMERIRKIQAQNDTAISIGDTYVFSRICCNNKAHEVFDLPSLEEIEKEIENAKTDATRDALSLGLMKRKGAKNFDFSCKINPYVTKRTTKKYTTDRFQGRSTMCRFEFDKLALTNFSDQFDGKEIPHTSPFVEVYYDKYEQKRVVVKKKPHWLGY